MYGLNSEFYYRAYKRFHSWFGLTYSVILAHSVLTLAMMSYGALLVSNKNMYLPIQKFVSW